MPGGAYSALSGMRTRLEELDRLAADLANVSTAGYKTERKANVASDRENFMTTLDSAVDVVLGGSKIDFKPGLIANTGRDLDVAIDGRGFFVIETETGPRYTRAGNFMRRSDGTLTTAEGETILGENSTPIRLPNRVGPHRRGYADLVIGEGNSSMPCRTMMLRCWTCERSLRRVVRRISATASNVARSSGGRVSSASASSRRSSNWNTDVCSSKVMSARPSVIGTSSAPVRSASARLGVTRMTALLPNVANSADRRGGSFSRGSTTRTMARPRSRSMPRSVAMVSSGSVNVMARAGRLNFRGLPLRAAPARTR